MKKAIKWIGLLVIISLIIFGYIKRDWVINKWNSLITNTPMITVKETTWTSNGSSSKYMVVRDLEEGQSIMLDSYVVGEEYTLYVDSLDSSSITLSVVEDGVSLDSNIDDCIGVDEVVVNDGESMEFKTCSLDTGKTWLVTYESNM